MSEGEECDDGNKKSADGCSAECKFEYCGDGVLQTTWEKCDDGNVESDDGCNWQCKVDTVKPKKPEGGGSGGGACTNPPALISDCQDIAGHPKAISMFYPSCMKECDGHRKEGFNYCWCKTFPHIADCFAYTWTWQTGYEPIDCGKKECATGPCSGIHATNTFETNGPCYTTSITCSVCRKYSDGTRQCKDISPVADSVVSSSAPPPPPAIELTLSGPASAKKGNYGTSVEYIITVKNISSSVIAKKLPVGLRLPAYVANVYPSPGVKCGKVVDGAVLHDNFKCASAFDIDPGKSTTINLSVTLTTDIHCGSMIDALANVGYIDRNFQSNTVSTTITCP